MNLPIERWLQFVLIVSGTALAWRAAFDLNMWLFSDAALTDRAHWVFLPAALRIMAVLILRTPGALGLMLGAYLTLPHAKPDLVKCHGWVDAGNLLLLYPAGDTNHPSQKG